MKLQLIELIESLSEHIGNTEGVEYISYIKNTHSQAYKGDTAIDNKIDLVYSRLPFYLTEDNPFKYIFHQKLINVTSETVYNVLTDILLKIERFEINKNITEIDRPDEYVIFNNIYCRTISKEMYQSVIDTTKSKLISLLTDARYELITHKYLKAESLVLLSGRDKTSIVLYTELKRLYDGQIVKIYQHVNSDINDEYEMKFSLLVYLLEQNKKESNSDLIEPIIKYMKGNNEPLDNKFIELLKPIIDEFDLIKLKQKIKILLKIGEELKPDYELKIKQISDSIDVLRDSIAKKLKKINQYNAMITSSWLGETENALEELTNYLSDVPELLQSVISINKEYIDDNVGIRLIIKHPLHFDLDLFNKYAAPTGGTLGSLPDVDKELFRRIAKGEVKLNMYAEFKLDLEAGLLYRASATNYVIPGCLANPHYYFHNCPGTLTDAVDNAIKNKSYIPMFHLLHSGAGQLNIDDGMVVSSFIEKHRSGKHEDLIVETPEGKMSVKEYKKYLKEEMEVPF